MSNRRPPTISESEWDLLGVLWETESATTREIAAALQGKRGWAYSTVKTLLDRMVEKGHVASRRVGNVYVYSAAIAPVDARRGAWGRFLGQAFEGAIDPAIRFIVKETRLSAKQKAELRRLIDELDTGEGDDR